MRICGHCVSWPHDRINGQLKLASRTTAGAAAENPAKDAKEAAHDFSISANTHK